jgi:hypothetical protein
MFVDHEKGRRHSQVRNWGNEMTKSANDPVEVSILGVVGGPIWVSAPDGQKVFDAISTPLRAGSKVSVSFSGRKQVITAFLNVAVGQLYSGKFSWTDIDARLSFADLGDGDLAKIEMVVLNAKRFFQQRNQAPGL